MRENLYAATRGELNAESKRHKSAIAHRRLNGAMSDKRLNAHLARAKARVKACGVLCW